MRLYRIGECPVQMVLVTFAKTKVTRAQRGSPALESNQNAEGGLRRIAATPPYETQCKLENTSQPMPQLHRLLSTQ